MNTQTIFPALAEDLSVKYLSIGFFLLIFFFQTPVLGASQGVSVSPPAPRTVEPRAFTTLAFTITNTGTDRDTFILTTHFPKGWSTISSLKPITLKPGQHKKKLITISVPPTALSNRPYPISLTITSKVDASKTATATAQLQVKDILGLRLTPEPSPELVWAGEIVKYGFEIKNLGNRQDSFEIIASSSEKWKIDLSKQKVELGPYEKEVVNLLLKVPSDVKQDQQHVLSFQVASVKAAEQGKEISDETKIRLKTITVTDTGGSTYLELPGSMQVEVSGGNDTDHDRPETKLRLEIAGDLNEAYFTRLYFNNTYFGEDTEEYRVDLNRKEKWDLSLGHTSADFTRLTEDLSGEGISTKTFGKYFETVFWAGLSDDDGGSDIIDDDDDDEDEDEEEDSTENDLYSVGAKITALINERGLITATSTFSDHKDKDWKKHLYSLAGEYQLFDPLILSGEVAYGTERMENVEEGDSAWFTRGDFNWKAMGLNAEYYHGGTYYPGGITDEEGVGIHSSYQPFESITLWLDYQKYNDNVDDNPESITTKTEKISGGPQFRYGHWPTIDVTWEQEKEESDNITQLLGTDRVEKTISLGLYKAFPLLSISARGKWGREKDPKRNTSTRISEYNAALGGYVKPFNWEVAYTRDESLERYADASEISEKMEYRLGCRLFNMLDINAEYTNEITKSDNGKSREETVDVDLTLTRKIGIGKRHSLDLKFEGNNLTEDEDKEWRVGVTWHSEIGVPVFWIKTKARVKGQLFLDEDGNKTWGPKEKVYPKTRITLNRMHVYTDENGRFEFPVVEPGNYILDIDASNLASGIIPKTSFPMEITLEKGDKMFLDIPLEQVGTIQGMVFDDKDKSLDKNDNEEGISPIRLILLKDGKEVHEGFTDPKGKYILTDIKPGNYVLKIDTAYLPRRYVMTTAKTIPVKIVSKEQVLGLNFGAYEKPRKIIKTFFKKKNSNERSGLRYHQTLTP